ncbi:MAG: CBS domain-containing protein [Oligoflexia bacterium]|nr:CBS domain-containing protein [Oligoflexia bacterium]
MRSIQPFIQRKVVVLHDDATIRQAARAMREHRIGCVVVGDHQGHVVGIVTDRDLVNGAIAEGSQADETPLAEVMTQDPLTVDEATDLKQIVQLMEERGVRRVPVVHYSPSGRSVRCAGVVTLDDLIATKAVNLDHLSRIVQAQLKRKVLSGREAEGAKKEASRFYEVLSSKIGPELSFNLAELAQLTSTALDALVRRLHHTAALRLIGELPLSLQGALLALPPGPDESVDLSGMATEVCLLFSVDDPTAHSILVHFGAALDAWCDPVVLDHIKAQLPKDLLNLFPAPTFYPERSTGAA